MSRTELPSQLPHVRFSTTADVNESTRAAMGQKRHHAVQHVVRCAGIIQSGRRIADNSRSQ